MEKQHVRTTVNTAYQHELASRHHDSTGLCLAHFGNCLETAISTLTRRIMLTFGGLMAVQGLVGILVLIARGDFGRWQF